MLLQPFEGFGFADDPQDFNRTFGHVIEKAEVVPDP